MPINTLLDRPSGFGPFRIDPTERILLCDGQVVAIGPRVFHLLVALVSKAGHTCTRDELLEEVWGDAATADASNVNQGIWLLRKALEPEGSHLIQTVRQRGYRFSGKLVEIDEHAVPETASEALEPPQPSTVADAPEGLPKGGSPFRAVLLAVGVFVFVAGAWLLTNSRSDESGQPVENNDSERLLDVPTVAVIGIDNVGPEISENAAWISEALARLAISELLACDCLRVAPERSVSLAKEDLGVARFEMPEGRQLEELAEVLDFDYVLQGSFLSGGPDGQTIRVDLNVEDWRTGETLAVAQASGDLHNLGDVVATLGFDVRQRFVQLGISSNSAQIVPASQDIETIRAVSEATLALREYDAQAARSILESVVAQGRANAALYGVLADAYRELGMQNKEREAAIKALSMSQTRPALERKRIEARFSWANNDHERAIELFDELTTRSPNDIDLGLNFARAYRDAGMPARAFAVIENLKSLPAALSSDPRIDNLGGATLVDLARQEEALVWAQRGRQAALEIGAQPLAAQSLLVQSAAYHQLGNLPEMVETAGAAAVALEKAGNFTGVLIARNNQGGAYSVLGRLAEAKTALSAAIDVAERIGALDHAATIRINLGGLEMKTGGIDAAEQHYVRSLVHFEGAGNKVGVARCKSQLGEVHIARGQPAKAELVLREAERLSIEAGQLSDLVNIYALLTMAYVQQGNTVAAIEAGNSGIDADNSGATTTSLSVRTHLARAYKDAGKIAEAERLLERVVEDAGRLDMVYNHYAALEQLSALRIIQNRLTDAEDLARTATEITERLDQRLPVISTQLLAARLDAYRGRTDSALRHLESAADQASETLDAQALRSIANSFVEVFLLVDAASDARDFLGRRADVVADGLFDATLLDARVQLRLTQCSKGRGLLSTQRQRAVEFQNLRAQLEADLELARCDTAAGRPIAETLREIARVADESGFEIHASEARALLARTG